MYIVIYCPDCGNPTQVYDEFKSLSPEGTKIRRNYYHEQDDEITRIYVNNRLEHTCRQSI